MELVSNEVLRDGVRRNPSDERGSPKKLFLAWRKQQFSWILGLASEIPYLGYKSNGRSNRQNDRRAI